MTRIIKHRRDAPQMTSIPFDLALTRLLSQVAAKDRIAFGVLYNQTHAKLYGVVARILPRSDLARDALQETYLRIWLRARDFDPVNGSPMAWMATIARNQALDEVRRPKPIALDAMPGNFEPAAAEFDPLDSRDRSERLRAVLYCLSKLDARKREMILLAYYHGATREVLSKRFGAPVPTIKTWLHRSLAQLRHGLVLSLSLDELSAAEDDGLARLRGLGQKRRPRMF